MVSMLKLLEKYVFFDKPETEKIHISDIVELLSSQRKTKALLYISIPFCALPCDYLNVQHIHPYKSRTVYKYLTKLTNHIYELEGISQKIKIEHVVISGGETTALDSDDINDMIQVIYDVFDIHGKIIIDADISDLLEFEKIEELYSAGVDLINLQIPSVNKEELDNFGRQDISSEDIREVSNKIRESDFSDILFTTNYLFPGNKVTSFKETLSFLLELAPSRILVAPYHQRKGTHLYEKMKLRKIEKVKCKEFKEYSQQLATLVHKSDYFFITPRMIAKRKSKIKLGNFEYLTSSIDFLAIGPQSSSRLGPVIFKYPSLNEFLSAKKMDMKIIKVSQNFEAISKIAKTLFNLEKIEINKLHESYRSLPVLDDIIEWLDFLTSRKYLIRDENSLLPAERGFPATNLLMYQLNRYILKT